MMMMMPPTETQFAESDQDSDALDAGAEGDSTHLPRRVPRSSGELSLVSDKPETTRKPLPTEEKPTKNLPQKKEAP